jgi:hypothetical protein
MQPSETKRLTVWTGKFDHPDEVEDVSQALLEAFLQNKPVQVIIFKEDKDDSLHLQEKGHSVARDEGRLLLLSQAVSASRLVS